MQWLWSNLPTIGELTGAHVVLSVIPIVVSFVLAIPLGYVASRSRVARGILLTVGDIAYTIPGIALLLLIPAIVGLPILDPTNLVIALTIYGLALMVRSATDAFASVSRDIVQSAEAVGFSRTQRFFSVELPLALPVLFASLRVVSVSTVSLATIGVIVGIDTLGNLFTEAFQRSFFFEALVGIVVVLLLAAVFDLVINGVGRLLTPWNRAPSTRRARKAVAA